MVLKVVAFEAGGSQQLLWAGDEIQMGEEEEGRAQSHLGEVGSNREMSRYVVVEKEVVEGVGMETRGAVGAVQSATPGEPTADWPSSACLVWVVLSEWMSPSKETRSLMMN